ncbi:IPT/TIG domain-containing protein [Streptomyces sp. LX-29]|uniref:IPT/TIG domain-containing protein n=1 Tax=Streptomyces sp. LX-29 TaxID=2900152 RepID=UPI00240D8152|nr:IPT/TIG domain-containing protein [Streptomyces sp. LX-29]WFB05683.1 IPT/TIG domain-containing protein [Streptomyces sp. LX-29]
MTAPSDTSPFGGHSPGPHPPFPHFPHPSGGRPIIVAVVPATGPGAGGTTVAILGSGFNGATSVRFGANQATSFTVVSDHVITAVTPPGSGVVQVTVTTPRGTSNGFPYIYYAVNPVPPPVIAAVVPSSGPAAGGNTVTITGSGFTGATAVVFGLNPATSFTVISDNLITAVVPAGVGVVPVTVIALSGVSNPVNYTYISVPVLTLVIPPSGSAAGGDTVALLGSGFTGATAVAFGLNPATSFTVISDNLITAVAPAGSGVVPVTVTAPSGTSNAVNYTYTAVPAPVLNAVVPSTGSSAGGETVLLVGSGFTGATAVTYGLNPATSFTVVSDNLITTVTPAGSGTVSVNVTTAAGVSNSLPYIYV